MVELSKNDRRFECKVPVPLVQISQDQVQCMVVPCQPSYNVDDVPIFNAGDVSLVEVSTDEESITGATAFKLKGGRGLDNVSKQSTLR